MDIAGRLAALDWTAIEQSLWAHGYAKTAAVLTADECAALEWNGPTGPSPHCEEKSGQLDCR